MKSMKKLKIVVVNVWHDDNKGDGGICEGVLSLIQQKYPDAKLGIVSMFPDSSPAFKAAHRHLIQRFPDLEVAPSPFLAVDPSKSTSWTQKVWHLPGSFFRLFPLFSQSLPGLRLISEADLVIANGGQYLFTDRKYFNSTFRVFRSLYPLLVAKSYKIPYILFSQSFGFYTAESNRLDNALVRSVLNHAEVVFAREELSKQELLKVGILESKVAVLPDSAFAIKPQMSERVGEIMSKLGLQRHHFWVITVRKWKEHTESFLDEMAALVKTSLKEGMTDKIVLVAHTQGPSQGENDRIATHSLAKRIDHPSVLVMEEDLRPGELAAFYGEASLMIGTRFHSIIFALDGGTPAYAVSYAGPKTWGIMEMLGLKQLCSDMNQFSAQETLERIQAVDLAQLSSEIPGKIQVLCQQLEDKVESLLKEV